MFHVSDGPPRITSAIVFILDEEFGGAGWPTLSTASCAAPFNALT
jgi:hypothetical protein